MRFFNFLQPSMPEPGETLPGRNEPILNPGRHTILGTPLAGPWPEGTKTAIFGLGCFWGAEKAFWEDHDPTQGFRQGNDIGTQYRSIILTTDAEQQRIAEMSRDAYQATLSAAGYGEIKTEIRRAGPFYYAEDYHQQYLDKVPNGYCPVHATGVKLPADFSVTPLQYVD